MVAQTRLPGIQALRAIAALLVVWVHTIPAHYGVPGGAPRFYWRDFGSCGVDIFFVISGFIVCLVAARAPSAGQFLRQRITRVFPVYWVVTSVLLAGVLAFPQAAGARRIWWVPTVLLQPTFSYPANPPLLYLGWTLLFEIYFYLVLAMFLQWGQRGVVRNTMLFLCAMVLAGGVLGIERPLLVVWMNPLILEFVFGCGLGVLYARGSGKRHVRVGKALAVSGGALLTATLWAGPHAAVQLTSVFAGEGCWQRVLLWGVPAALLVGGVVFWAPTLEMRAGRWLVFLGNASYSIYLFTIPALWIARYAWHMLGRPSPWGGALVDGLWAVFTGVLGYWLVERPLTGFFHCRFPSGQRPVLAVFVPQSR